MNKVLIICGPTSTGKTSLGISLAKKLGGEIVSADSRQVYRCMDIGTGKDLPRRAKLKMKNEKLQIKAKNGQILRPYRFDGIPVWLLDVVNPDQEFSVAHYVEVARGVVKDVWRRGKSRPNVEDHRHGASGLPIIVGGTGYYIKGLIDGIENLGMQQDWELRERLSNLAIEQLRRKLQKLDPGRLEKMNESDGRNSRRLIRAIEIALKITRPRPDEVGKNKNDSDSERIENSRQSRNNAKLKIDEVLMIGLKAPNEILYQRIDERVDKRIKQGMIEEVENLLKMGMTHERLFWFGMEYRAISEYLQGLLTKEETTQKLKYKIHAYARRQMTWFKRDSRIRWIDITKQNWKNKIESLIERWYNPN